MLKENLYMVSPNIDNELCDQVLITLRKIVRAIDIHSRKLVKDYGLTVPQLIILKELKANGTISVGDLAKNIDLTHATVTSILDRLVKLEYVERTRSDTDRRRVYVEISKKGIDIVETTPPLLQERFIDEFHRLQNWEQTLILSTLQRIAFMMDAKNIDAAPLLLNEPIFEQEENISKNEENKNYIHLFGDDLKNQYRS